MDVGLLILLKILILIKIKKNKDGYRLYASVILITSLISVISTVVDSKRNIIRLREMSKFEIKVNVFRGEFRVTDIENDTKQVRVHENILSKGKLVSSYNLVPGDIV